MIAIIVFIILAVPITIVTFFKVKQIVDFQEFLDRARFRVGNPGDINITKSYNNLVQLPFWSIDYLSCVVWEKTQS